VKIDTFCHVMPKRYVERIADLNEPLAADLKKRTSAIPSLWDMDERFRIMDQFEDYVQLPSLAAPAIEAFQKHAPELSQLANDEMAELVSRNPDRFVGFVASLPLSDVDQSLAEIDRAVDDLGALGIQVHTHVNGVPFDDERFMPLFQKMDEVNLPIWVHPGRNSGWPDYPTEDKSKYEIWWLFGWPYDTAVFMARLVFSGILERYANLKIITHHGGSMVPYFAGRAGAGMDQYGARTPDTESALLSAHTTLKERPIDYFKRFYADTALFGAKDAIECALGFFGADHMLFASDTPFDPEKGPAFIRETIANVDALDIDQATRHKIYEQNARDLLGLAPVTPSA
jgi:aminocarboxymuconate-semialdehyde decarboxylase